MLINIKLVFCNLFIKFACKILIYFHLDKIVEKKRRVYDQYGKEGLMGHNDRHHRSRRHEYDDLDFGFVFRSPDEVFREFFGVNSPFAEIFGL